MSNPDNNALPGALPGAFPGAPPQTERSLGEAGLNLNITSAPEALTEPAGFWIRFVACIIDGLILGIASAAISYPVTFGLALAMNSEIGGILSQAAGFALGLGASYFYYGWFYTNKGGSPGKLLFDLRVARMDTGATVTWNRAFGRECAKYLSWATLSIGFIMAGVREDKRALHDLIADTQVTRVRK
jgi:uncharacterized RDD family membrane protein YckC